MKSRGRQSAAEQTTPAVISERRPAPPASLTEAQAAVWQRVAGCLPGDYFRPAQYPLLEAYCRHVIAGAVLDQQIDAFESDWLKLPDGLDRYTALLNAREKQTRAILATARSLRLTHQSMTDPRKAGRINRDAPASDRRPWDVD